MTTMISTVGLVILGQIKPDSRFGMASDSDFGL